MSQKTSPQIILKCYGSIQLAIHTSLHTLSNLQQSIALASPSQKPDQREENPPCSQKSLSQFSLCNDVKTPNFVHHKAVWKRILAT
jgi:hypothetical protein